MARRENSAGSARSSGPSPHADTVGAPPGDRRAAGDPHHLRSGRHARSPRPESNREAGLRRPGSKSFAEGFVRAWGSGDAGGSRTLRSGLCRPAPAPANRAMTGHDGRAGRRRAQRPPSPGVTKGLRESVVGKAGVEPATAPKGSGFTDRCDQPAVASHPEWMTGLEPARHTPPEPQSGPSTTSGSSTVGPAGFEPAASGL